MASLASLIKKLTPEQRQRIARYVASMPEDVGGLNMPLNNTAMQRAKALGFDTPSYHATIGNPEYTAFEQLDPLLSSRTPQTYWDAIGVHSGTPQAAEDALYTAHDRMGITDPNDIIPTGFHTYPLLIKGEKKYLHPEFKKMDFLKDKPEEQYFMDEPGGGDLDFLVEERYGDVDDLYEPSHYKKIRNSIFKKHDVLPYRNEAEDVGSISYISHPKNVRSRFAAFNPWLKGSSDLLASHPAATLMATGGLSGLARRALDKPFDPTNQYSQYGMEAPYSTGDIALQGLGVTPYIGNAATLVDLLRQYK